MFSPVLFLAGAILCNSGSDGTIVPQQFFCGGMIFVRIFSEGIVTGPELLFVRVFSEGRGVSWRAGTRGVLYLYIFHDTPLWPHSS